MATLRRRLVTIPCVFVFAGLIVGLLPLWLVLAALVDVVRWVRRRIPFALTRLVLFGAVYLLGQVLGVLALFCAWLFGGFGSGRTRLIARTYAIQRRWVALMLGTVKRLYRMRIELIGEEALGPPPGGPLIALMQHTSLVDTLLPTTYLTARRGLKLRWVLKKELLVDPCLDIAGLRLNNAFVGRDGSETERALAQVRALATDLPPDEGVLIYPEGTRFTPEKRARALARMATSAPELLARAEALRRVLPPRLGGPLALLETAREADVLLIGHIGFEGLSSLGSVLSGALVGRVVQLRYWHFRRSEVPSSRAELVLWLWARWEELDAWVDGVDGVDRVRGQARRREAPAGRP